MTLPPSEYLLTFAFFCHRPFQFSQTETVLSLLSAFGLKLYCLSSAHLSDDPKLVDKEIVKSPPLTMASLIAILDLKGKPLIQRSYRDDVPPSYIEKFLPIVLDLEEEGQQVTPCFTREGVNYMHIRHSNLYRESAPTRSCGHIRL